MRQQLFIGVDGGATKCIVRVEDAAGNLLGRETSGPANIRLSVEKAWESILLPLNKILKANALDITRCQLHAGIGIAGCEVTDAYQAFIKYVHPFTSLVVVSDAHTACLGAHQGKDGAIIIAGTGVVGYQQQANQHTKIGGGGFPHDDEGGGAWIGLAAMRATLQSLDGRASASGIADAVYDKFQRNQTQLIIWANQANSTAYAELAPLVIQQSKLHDATSIGILQQAATHIDVVHEALLAAQTDKQQPLSCTLIGGVATFLEPYLCAALQARLSPAAATPDVGALLLVRNHLKEVA